MYIEEEGVGHSELYITVVFNIPILLNNNG
jgi:hypothetical protein